MLRTKGIPVSRRAVLTACGAALLALTVAETGHAWAHGPKANHLRINSEVALPGVVLPPGHYVFEVANPDSGQDIVRVSSRAGKVYFTGFTLRVQRPRNLAKGQAVILGEAPAGIPQPIRGWYPAGFSFGNEFMYR